GGVGGEGSVGGVLGGCRGRWTQRDEGGVDGGDGEKGENRQHDTSHHLIGLLRPWILACSLPCQLEYRASRPHRPARARRSPVHGGLAVAVVRRDGQLTHGGVGGAPSMASPPPSVART